MSDLKNILIKAFKRYKNDPKNSPVPIKEIKVYLKLFEDIDVDKIE